MANQKISDLTSQPTLSAIDGLAGYEGTSNVRISGQNIIDSIPTLYTTDGTLSEDRVITVDHDATTKASYTTTFESNKTTNTTTRNTALGTRLILTETVTSAPTGYSANRGAGVNLTHNSSGDDVTGTVNVQSINSGTSDYYGRSQMGFRTNTGFVFSQEGTAPSSWSGDALIVRDRLASNQSKSLRYHPSQSDGGRLRLCAPNAKTSQILFATNISNTFYRYISGKNTGALTLGRKLTSGNEEAYITCNGIGGSASADIAVGINQDTPTATLHVTGSSPVSSTTAFLVENSLGDEIIRLRDDKTVRLGFNGNQITTTASFGGQVNLNNTSGNSLFRVDTVSGSTGRITVSQGGWRSFEYAASQGLVLTNEAGFHVAQDASSMLTCIGSTKGMLPPRMTTTQRDAINGGTFTTGLTLYNTTDNELQYYDGTSWISLSTSGSNLIGLTSITASSQVEHEIKLYSSTTSNNFAAINFNSDGTDRYAKVTFTPSGTVARVVFRALAKDLGGTSETWLGLHSSSSQTAGPNFGWFLMNKDSESGEYEHITAEWLLTGLTAGEEINAYVMGIASSSGHYVYARSLNTSNWVSTGSTTAFPATVEAYDINITITSNPSS